MREENEKHKLSLSVCWLVFVVSFCVVFAFFCRRRLRRRRRLLLLLLLRLLPLRRRLLLGDIFGCSWLSWGWFGGCFCASWSLLGASIGHLGRSWGGLGRPWGHLARTREGDQISGRTWIGFWTVLGGQRGAQTTPRRHPEAPRWPKRAPRRNPRRTKTNDKFNFKNDIVFDPS